MGRNSGTLYIVFTSIGDIPKTKCGKPSKHTFFSPSPGTQWQLDILPGSNGRMPCASSSAVASRATRRDRQADSGRRRRNQWLQPTHPDASERCLVEEAPKTIAHAQKDGRLLVNNGKSVNLPRFYHEWVV